MLHNINDQPDTKRTATCSETCIAIGHRRSSDSLSLYLSLSLSLSLYLYLYLSLYPVSYTHLTLPTNREV